VKPYYQVLVSGEMNVPKELPISFKFLKLCYFHYILGNLTRITTIIKAYVYMLKQDCNNVINNLVTSIKWDIL
jgi:hypothetical protein